MKPRTKEQIEKAIRYEEGYLEGIIDKSVRAETRSSEHIRETEKRLERLREEPCFEDTLAGRIEAEEKRVLDQICASLDELSAVVGLDYAKRFKLAVIELQSKNKDKD